MGRILKKKTTVKKKRKSEGESDVDAPDAPAPVRAAALQRKPAAAPKAPGKENWLTKSIQFLREVRAELKKVTWPSRKQTIGSTAVVIILVMIISVFLGMVDMGLSALVRVVLQ